MNSVEDQVRAATRAQASMMREVRPLQLTSARDDVVASPSGPSRRRAQRAVCDLGWPPLPRRRRWWPSPSRGGDQKSLERSRGRDLDSPGRGRGRLRRTAVLRGGHPARREEHGRWPGGGRHVDREEGDNRHAAGRPYLHERVGRRRRPDVRRVRDARPRQPRPARDLVRNAAQPGRRVAGPALPAAGAAASQRPVDGRLRVRKRARGCHRRPRRAPEVPDDLLGQDRAVAAIVAARRVRPQL